MKILKGQRTEYLEAMIKACHELWAWYRRDDQTLDDCPLCKVLISMTTAGSSTASRPACRDGQCPWFWFTAEACPKNAVDARMERLPRWTAMRNRQLPRWIACMEAELEERKG